MKPIAEYIESTLLKPDITAKDIYTLCKDARANNFNCVIVPPFWVKYAAKLFYKVGTVINFPLGGNTIQTQLSEYNNALEDGATVIDMVANIGFIKSKDLKSLRTQVQSVLTSEVENKVIIETGLLTYSEIALTVKALRGIPTVDFIKTSTGYGPRGVTTKDIQIIKENIDKFPVGIKASGGIKTFEDVRNLISVGADRIGTSSAVSIMKQAADFIVI